MAAACACLVDYDSFARHYADRSLLSPSAQAGFRVVAGRAVRPDRNRLLHRSPPASAEAPAADHLWPARWPGMQRTLR